MTIRRWPLWLITLLWCVLPTVASAQIVLFGGGARPKHVTVSGLPPGASPDLYVVTDGTTGQDCAIGGASTHVLCHWNATALAWQAIGDGNVVGEGGAPDNATYVTGTANGSLTSELVLGTAVIMRGTHAARPAATLAGRLYWYTDAPLGFARDTGSAWEEFSLDSGQLVLPGADTQVLFRDGAVIGADAGMVFNKTTNALTLTGPLNAPSLAITGAANAVQVGVRRNAGQSANIQEWQTEAGAALATVSATGVVTAVGFTGPLTGDVIGNADTATALDGNPTDCNAGQAPLGIDAGGAAQGCFDVATQTELDNHLNDASAAHAASAISFTPVGTIAATDVQAALGEVASEAFDTDDQTAAEVAFTPAGNLAAVTVQAALQELDGEKAATVSAVMDGDTAGGVLSGTYPNPGFASDMATQLELDNHVNDTAGAHAATAISFTPAGTISATNVQAALEEVAAEGGGGGGTAVALDLADNGADESAALIRINISGDTNSIFTEPLDNELLINVGLKWPAASAADALTSNPSDCNVGEYANAIAANGNLTCAQVSYAQLGNVPSTLVETDQGNTYTTGAQDFGSATSLKVPTAAGASPTASGLIAYDATSNTLEVGVNAANKTVAFTDSNITGNAATATTAAALTSDPTDCSAGEYATTIAANGNLTCAQVAYTQLGSVPSTLVETDQGNTYSTGAQDFGSATSLKVPASAGANPTAAGLIAYDTTANALEVGINGANKTVAMTDSNITGNAATASALAADPDDCGAGTFATTIAASGALTCAQVAYANLGSVPTTLVKTDQGNTYTTGAQDFASATSLKVPAAAGASPTASGLIAYDTTSNTLEVGVNTANKTVAFTDSSITGNAATATALASDPSDCSAGQYATTIAASGALTCAQVSYAQLGSVPATLVETDQGNTYSTGAQDFGSATSLKVPTTAGAGPTASGLIAYDSTANAWEAGVNGSNKTFAFTDSNITGNASTATALASDPGDCGANQYATTIAASGALTCAQVSFAQLSNVPATIVETDQANTYSTGAQDFAAATSLKVPTAAGANPTASGLIAYDSTANAFEVGVNGSNATLATQTFVNAVVPVSYETLQTVTDGATAIDCGTAVKIRTVPVVSASGNVTMTANPQIVDGLTNGQLCDIVGTSDTDTVTFSHGTGLVLIKGAGTVTLGNAKTLSLLWTGSMWQQRLPLRDTAEDYTITPPADTDVVLAPSGSGQAKVGTAPIVTSPLTMESGGTLWDGTFTACDAGNPCTFKGGTVEYRVYQSGGAGFNGWHDTATTDPLPWQPNCPTGETCGFTGDDNPMLTFDADSATVHLPVNHCIEDGTGSDDTYTCNFAPALDSYVDGTLYSFEATVANTGEASLNINGLGAKIIVKVAGGVATTLANDDIRAGQKVIVQYDLSADNFQMQSTLGNAASGSGDVIGDDTSTTAQNIVAYTGTGGKNITELTGTQGDILYHNGTNWAKLAAGTATHLLQTNGAGQNPSWVAPPSGGGSTEPIRPISAVPSSAFAYECVLNGMTWMCVTDATTLTADVTWQLVFPMPAALATGCTYTLLIDIMTAATPGTQVISIRPEWNTWGYGATRASLSLNSETVTADDTQGEAGSGDTIGLTSADEDQLLQVGWTLNASTVTAGQPIAMNIVTVNATHTLAVEFGMQPYLVCIPN
jgi:hypothetical protein